MPAASSGAVRLASMRPQQFAEEDLPSPGLVTRGSNASMRPQQFAEEDDTGFGEAVHFERASMRPQQFAEEDESSSVVMSAI